jgi:hypothetical protein
MRERWVAAREAFGSAGMCHFRNAGAGEASATFQPSGRLRLNATLAKGEKRVGDSTRREPWNPQRSQAPPIQAEVQKEITQAPRLQSEPPRPFRRSEPEDRVARLLRSLLPPNPDPVAGPEDQT